jgi:hypothetical protein
MLRGAAKKLIYDYEHPEHKRMTLDAFTRKWGLADRTSSVNEYINSIAFKKFSKSLAMDYTLVEASGGHARYDGYNESIKNVMMLCMYLDSMLTKDGPRRVSGNNFIRSNSFDEQTIITDWDIKDNKRIPYSEVPQANFKSTERIRDKNIINENNVDIISLTNIIGNKFIENLKLSVPDYKEVILP